jgi:hypothetical protein
MFLPMTGIEPRHFSQYHVAVPTNLFRLVAEIIETELDISKPVRGEAV